MVEITFLRHGESESNIQGIMAGVKDYNLTQKGTDQAKEFSKNQRVGYDVYFCSPLKRTHQTLEAMKPGQKFIIDRRLTEVNSGDWAGKMKKDLPKDLYDLYKNGKMDPPNGETLAAVDERILSFLTDVFDKYHGDEKILVVAHNALMRSLRRLFFEAIDDQFEPKNLETITISREMYDSLGQ